MKNWLTGFTSSLVLMLSSCEKEMNPADPGSLVPKTVDENRSLPSINVNGTQLHAEAFGNPADPMVVFLHGGPGSDYRNALNVKQLIVSKYYVVFYDQRGSGLSQRHPKDSYSIQLMIDDLKAVIQNYKTSPIQKVFLFGHSWGAMLATAYINQNPTHIRGLILAEPGGFNWDDVKGYTERSKKFQLFSETTNDIAYHDQFFSIKSTEQEIIDYKLALNSAFSFAKNNVEGIEGSSPFWRYGSGVASKFFDIGKKDGFDFSNRLNNYATQVLFLYSEKNKAYGEGYAKKVATVFPKKQIIEIQQTGHEMIYFGWSLIYPLAVTYLNSLR